MLPCQSDVPRLGQLSSSAEVLSCGTWLFLSLGIFPALPQLQLPLMMLNFGMEESAWFQHYSPQKQCGPLSSLPTGGIANRALLELFELIPGRASCCSRNCLSCAMARPGPATGKAPGQPLHREGLGHKSRVPWWDLCQGEPETAKAPGQQQLLPGHGQKPPLASWPGGHHCRAAASGLISGWALQSHLCSRNLTGKPLAPAPWGQDMNDKTVHPCRDRTGTEGREEPGPGTWLQW